MDTNTKYKFENKTQNKKKNLLIRVIMLVNVAYHMFFLVNRALAGECTISD